MCVCGGGHHGRGTGSIRVGTGFKGFAFVHISRGREESGPGDTGNQYPTYTEKCKGQDVWQVRNCSVQPTLTSCSNGLAANRLPRILYAFTQLLPFSFSLFYRNSLMSQSDHIRHLLKILTEKVKQLLQWRMHPLPHCLSNSAHQSLETHSLPIQSF